MTRASLGRLGRAVIALLGVAAIVALVADAGAAAVLRAIMDAGAWLPTIALAEVVIATADVASLRALHGAHASRAPAGVWLRSAMLAFAAGVFLPGGRVAGELARATQLAPYLGGARAVAAATVGHGAFLWANALMSIACYLAVASASSPTSLLALLVAANGAWTGALGALLLFGPRSARFGERLARRAPTLAARGEDLDHAVRAMPAAPLVSLGTALLARGAHVVQCGIVLVAVGGACAPGGALVAEAIYLVAANVGDAVPGQAGVIEGAYRMFAPSLGLSSAVAQALAIALLVRVCRLGLAAASAAACAVWSPAPAATVSRAAMPGDALPGAVVPRAVTTDV